MRRTRRSRCVPVSREGSLSRRPPALRSGGKTPVILIQNTRLMESGELAARLGLGLNIPGGAHVGSGGWDASRHHAGYGRGLHRTLSECFWHQLLPGRSNADAPRIAVAFEEARKTKRPVAVLVGDEYHGFNR